MQEQTWTMVLRCYHCSGKFTLTHMPLERLTSVTLIAVCPHCGARPEFADKNQRSRLHRVFDLRSDRAHRSKTAA